MEKYTRDFDILSAFEFHLRDFLLKLPSGSSSSFSMDVIQKAMDFARNQVKDVPVGENGSSKVVESSLPLKKVNFICFVFAFVFVCMIS